MLLDVQHADAAALARQHGQVGGVAAQQDGVGFVAQARQCHHAGNQRRHFVDVGQVYPLGVGQPVGRLAVEQGADQVGGVVIGGKQPLPGVGCRAGRLLVLGRQFQRG